MELRDSLTLLFSCSKIHCYLLPIFVYPITARLDKYIHQNLETPLYLYRGSHEHGTAESSLLLADHSEDKTSSYQFRQLLDVTPSTRDHARRQEPPQPVAEQRRDDTSGHGTSVSDELRTPRHGCFPRHQERLHLQAGEGVRTR